MIAVRADDGDALRTRVRRGGGGARRAGRRRAGRARAGTRARWRPGCARLPAANLAIVSVPGDFAAREARRALERGLNVMLFSDNVAVEDEVALKALARERGISS